MAQGRVARSKVALFAVILLVVVAGCSSDDSDTANEATTTSLIAASNSPDTSTLSGGDARHPDGTTITVALDAIEGLRGHVVAAWVLPVELNEDKDAIGGIFFSNITDDPFSDSQQIQPQDEDRYFDVTTGEPSIVEPGTYRFIIEAYVPSGPMHYGCEMPIAVDGGEPLVLTLASLPIYTGAGWHWSSPEQLRYPGCPNGAETSAVEPPSSSSPVVQTTPPTTAGVDAVSTTSMLVGTGDSDERPVAGRVVEIEYQDGVWLSLHEPEAAGCPDDGWPTIVTGGPSSSLLSQEFAVRGYLVAEVDWRAPGYTGTLDSATLRAFQFAVGDLGVAVQWLRAHAVEWCVDPGRIAAMGYSFGAITSLSLAYTRGELEVGSEVSIDELGGEGDVAERPVPPPELDAYPDDVGAVVSFAGFAIADTIETGEPPALLFHGRNDGTIAFELAKQTCAAASAVGVSCELVAHDSGHAMADDVPNALDRADQFLRSELGIED